MSKRQILMLLGIVVIFLPFLGFLSSWDRIISLVIGILIVIISYRLSVPNVEVFKNSDWKASSENKEQTFPFVEFQAKVEEKKDKI